MSITYVSGKIKHLSVTLSNDAGKFDTLKNFVAFTKEDAKTSHKSVEVTTLSDDTDEMRVEITFRGYEKQKDVDLILKSFSLMLNTTFTDEEDFNE